MKINVKFFEGTKIRTKFDENEKAAPCEISETDQ